MKLLGACIVITALSCAPSASAQTTGDVTAIAVVVHVSTPSLFRPDGSPAPDRDGRLDALASALDALDAPDISKVPLAIAPSAVMCDEAMRLRGAAPKHFLRSLRRVAARSTVLGAPFANVRLVDLGSGAAGGQLTDGRSAIERCTGVAPANVLYPPGLVVDDGSVQLAKAAGATAVLTSAVGEPVKAAPDLLPAAVVSGSDTPSSLLKRRPSKAFAVVTETGSSTATFLRALTRDPRIGLRTVTQIDAVASDVGHVTLPSPPPPPVSYRRALLRADDAFTRFTAVTLPDNPITAVYRDVLARARGSADLAKDFTPGRRLADALSGQIDTALRSVSVGRSSITFTSRRGSVPVTVINGLRYPVRVSVAVSSPKLDFPGGEERAITIQPPGDTITFAAVARSTGSFPMLVTLRTPDDVSVIARGELTVRSTAANLPALAVTIGGFVLLIVFYIRRRKPRTAS